jgi:hypothetical protein
MSPSHGGGPFEDMKRSYAPENVSPGSLIPCVAGTKLEKIIFTAKLGLGNIKIYHVGFFFNFEVVDPF